MKKAINDIIEKNNKANINILNINSNEFEGVFAISKKLGFEIGLSKLDDCDYDAALVVSDEADYLNNKIIVNGNYPVAYKEFLIAYLLADFLLHGNNKTYVFKFNKTQKMNIKTLKLSNKILIFSIKNEKQKTKRKKD